MIWRSLSALLLIALASMMFGFIGGLRVGQSEPSHGPVRSPDPVVMARAKPPASPVQLRCANGDPPKAWTQAEVEGQIHLAIMARDTAMANAWNPTAERLVRIGQLTVEIVKLCREGQP